MLNKFTLLISFITIIFVHMAFLILYKSEEKKIVIYEKPSIQTIALKKVVLKKIEQKKEIQKVITPKKIEKEVEKIVKKAKRKVPKKIVEKVEKEIKEVKELEKEIKKLVKEDTPKIKPTITKKVIPNIKKEVTVSNIDKNMIQNEYLLKLRKTIENHKRYPKRAKRLKQEGKVIVSFEITKNGHIKKILLKNSCPYRRLNSAAVELLEQIARFEPIPKELGKNSWTIEVPIHYSIVNI